MDTTETTAKLPGEGDTKLVRHTRVRQTCDECGKPATYRYSFLLDNFRSNPASSGYRRDDCTYCSDLDRFACELSECIAVVKSPPTGYQWAGRATVSPGLAHLFLTWKEEVIPNA